MTVSWCLPTQVRDEMLQWCDMPLELYNSLAIVHQAAVHNEWYYRCKHKYVTYLHYPEVKRCVYCNKTEERKDVDRVHKEEAGR